MARSTEPAHGPALGPWDWPRAVARLGRLPCLLAAWNRRSTSPAARTAGAQVEPLVRRGRCPWPASWFRARLIDVGSGNGSPGLVLAFLRPGAAGDPAGAAVAALGLPARSRTRRRAAPTSRSFGSATTSTRAPRRRTSRSGPCALPPPSWPGCWRRAGRSWSSAPSRAESPFASGPRRAGPRRGSRLRRRCFT